MVELFLLMELVAVPRPYRQVLTIHVVFLATLLLLILNKDVRSYRQVIDKKQDFCSNKYEYGDQWFVIFQTEFPNVSIKGCYFHFNQSLWRSIQRLGLVNTYRNSRQVKKIMKKVMALGFLRLEILRMNFVRLRNSQLAR